MVRGCRVQQSSAFNSTTTTDVNGLIKFLKGQARRVFRNDRSKIYEGGRKRIFVVRDSVGV